MMRLLTGKAGSGKTALVLREFRAAVARGHSARLLVPTATLQQHLQNELARDGMVLRGRSVSTLARFLKDLAPDIEEVSDIHLHLMVEKAVGQLKREEFDRVAGLTGFHARLAATIAELDAAGATPKTLSILPRDIAPYQEALAAVWRHVEEQMRERRVVTRSQTLQDLSRRMPSLTVPAHIWIDGFAQLSAPEIDFLCALGQTSNVTLTLPEEGVPQHLKRTLVRRGFREEPLDGSGTRNPEVVCLRPETPERECEEIARKVIECSRRGTELRDMGVILRKPDKYAPMLQATFERFHIPARFYFNQPLGQHPAARLATGIVDTALGGWEHEQTLRLLRLVPETGTSRELDSFDIAVRNALPGRGLNGLFSLPKCQGRVTGALRRFETYAAWTGETASADDWADRIAGMARAFAPLGLGDRQSGDEAEHLRQYSAALDAYESALQVAAEWWKTSEPRLSLAQFWSTARSVIELSSFGSIARGRIGVQVMSAYEARQWDLSAVFVCGLVEKEFPARSVRNPFLPDSALQTLARAGLAIRTAADRDAEETGLFEAIPGRARSLLVLTYPRTDARGQRNLPSTFLQAYEAKAVATAVRPLLPEPIAAWRSAIRIQAADLMEALTTSHAKVTVTGLESLLQCPFQFFANKTLRIREMPGRPEDRLTSLVLGNIAHEVLRKWFVEKPAMEPLLNQVFAETCQKEGIVPGFRTERLRRSLWIAMRRFANDPRLPKTVQCETETLFTMVLDQHLTITGKFDRVDYVGEQQAIVIDYKYSTAATTSKKVDDPTKLQGPLYALAAREFLHREAIAMVYVSLRDERLLTVGWGKAEEYAEKGKVRPIPPNWIEKAVERVQAALTSYRLGVMEPRPASLDPCRYCAVRDACRVGEAAAVPASGS